MKTIERKQQFGEVYTPTKLVLEMIEKITIDPTKTYLDNSCGNGQFLVELLKQGIPLENIHGVDIQKDNAEDTIARLIIQDKFNIDIVDEQAKAKYKINVIEDDFTYSEYYYPDGVVYVREDSEFSCDEVGYFSYSFDLTSWDQINTIVRADALKYDYNFVRKVPTIQF
jgi:hypothetical protein